jgi:hypothetical protein
MELFTDGFAKAASLAGASLIAMHALSDLVLRLSQGFSKVLNAGSLSTQCMHAVLAAEGNRVLLLQAVFQRQICTFHEGLAVG